MAAYADGDQIFWPLEAKPIVVPVMNLTGFDSFANFGTEFTAIVSAPERFIANSLPLWRAEISKIPFGRHSADDTGENFDIVVTRHGRRSFRLNTLDSVRTLGAVAICVNNGLDAGKRFSHA